MTLRSAAAALPLILALAACKSDDAHHAAGPATEDPRVVASVSGVTTPSEAEIAGLFDLWNETLQSGSAHDMAMLYAEDGVLLPTVSNQARSNRPEITEYFQHFLTLQPRGAINEQYIHVLDSSTALNSGIYTFDVVRDGAPAFVVARYNFVYEKIGGKWLIKSHHSSAMPEPIEGRPATLAERRGARVRYAASEAPRAGHAPAKASAGHGASAHAAPAHAAPAHQGH